MAKSYEELKNEISAITNEVEDGANTANRIGGAMADIADFAKEVTEQKIKKLVVQETGDGEGVVMSQKAVTEKIGEVKTELTKITPYGMTIKITFWGSSLDWPQEERQVGQIMYDTNNRILRVWDGEKLVNDVVPVKDGNIYTYDGNFYIKNDSSSSLRLIQVTKPTDNEVKEGSANPVSGNGIFGFVSKEVSDVDKKIPFSEISADNIIGSSAIVYSTGAIQTGDFIAGQSVHEYILDGGEYIIETTIPNNNKSYAGVAIYNIDGSFRKSVVRCTGEKFVQRLYVSADQSILKVSINNADKLYVFKKIGTIAVGDTSSIGYVGDIVDLPQTIYGLHFNLNTINFAPNIFVEGIAKITEQSLRINGGARAIINNIDTNAKKIALKITADGYSEFDTNVSLVRSNITNLQSKNIRPMFIGDSLTDMGSSILFEYILKCYNQDLGDITCHPIGIVNSDYDLNLFGYTFSGKCGDEGRSGWGISDYLRHIVHVSKGTSLSSGTISGKAAWDSLGLGTMTRNGVKGRDYVEYTGSAEDLELMRITCHGYYDADPSAELWNWVYNYRKLRNFNYGGVDYSLSDSYSQNENDTLIIAFKYICTDFFDRYNYVNPFFNVNNAHLGSGENSYAFDLGTYLDRYKTIDESGNRLVVGSTAGTSITPSSINRHKVCLPTHCVIVMNQNDYSFTSDGEKIANDLKLCADLIYAYDSSIKVAIGVSRLYGAFNQGDYVDKGYTPSYVVSEQHLNTNIKLKELLTSSTHTYLPIYYCQSVLESKIVAIDTLNHGEILMATGDNIHGANNANEKAIVSHIDRMYQVIGWVSNSLE